MSISESSCILCCETVRDLGFWVDNQHTGRCTQGCAGEDCGTGFACQVGIAFLAGEIPPSQEDSTGTIRTYKCLPDGSVEDMLLVTLYPTAFPTVSPSQYPTVFPTTPYPSVSPTNNPTPFPTDPTVSPTQYPTVKPTLSPTEFPTTGTPTLFPTSFPTLSPGAVPSFPGGSSFFDDTASVVAVLVMAVVSCCICLCCCFVYCLCKLRPEKHTVVKENLKLKDDERTQSLPVIKAVLEKDIDDDGNPIVKENATLAQRLAAKARVASWRITRNVFSSNPSITHAKRDFKNQDRGQFVIPPFPTFRRTSDDSNVSLDIDTKELEALEDKFIATSIQNKVPLNQNKTKTDPSTKVSSASETGTEDIDL